MSVQVCVALLVLLSLTAASDPGCEELIRNVEDRTKLHGEWILHAGTMDCEDDLAQLKTVKSSWIELTPIPDSGNMTLRYRDKMGEKCYSGSVITTFDGNVTKATFNYSSSTHEHVGRHLETCPDCVLWVDTFTRRDKECRSFYMFTKSGKLDEAQQAVFKKQAGCLNFTHEFHFGVITDLCPDEEEAAEVKEEQ